MFLPSQQVKPVPPVRRAIVRSTRYARNSEEPAVRKMFAQIVVATVVLLGFGDVSAQSAKTASDQNVTGTWTLNAEGYVLPVTLHQDGTRLTGTLQLTHGPMAIVGEFKKGRIHFAGTSDGGGIRHDDDSNEIDVAAIGRLQPDGSLAGTMVSTVGDFTWRATRKE
jgi:hypothetical protein